MPEPPELVSSSGTGRALNVIIVGGSLGGLLSGVTLKRRGHNVRILERNPAPLLQNQGAGLVAGPNVQKFLKKHNIPLSLVTIPARSRIHLDKNNVQTYREKTDWKVTSWDLLYYLLRANFDGVSSSYCDVPRPTPREGTALYDYGCTVVDVRGLPGNVVQVQYRGRNGHVETSTADVLIGADGPSSTVRRLFEPSAVRSYVGYCAWRGTVPETHLSKETRAMLSEKVIYFYGPKTHILCYIIPGANGAIRPGHRVANMVWYRNYHEGSQAFRELMTDKNGIFHRHTLAADKVQPDKWTAQQNLARATLPRPLVEIVTKISRPFVQVITDVLASRSAFMGGKIILVGDALAGFRPHIAASTDQAAYNAELLAQMLSREVTVQAFDGAVMKYARDGSKRAVDVGQSSQFGALQKL
ncbi:MAG: hypothetical protein M4579_002179 [Chaenotheca gracillima]|nr:MAG: hypothetical protein M4579_002179 [Chaenotheca gracillima]